MAAAKELGLVRAAGMAKVERPVRKVAHEGAVESAEQKVAVLWATTAPAHAVAAAVDQKPVAPLAARPARAQANAGPRVGGEAALHQKSGLGWAHSAVLMEAVGARSELVTAEAAGVAVRAAASAPGAAAQGKAGCPVTEAAEAVEAASAPPASRSCLLL